MKMAYSAPAAKADSVARVSRLLVPTDFSTQSLAAVHAALDMATTNPDTRVTLLHVVEPEFPPMEESRRRSAHAHVELSERLHRADGQMKELRADCEPCAALETRVVTGLAAQAICHVAREEGSDLIVMSSHGYAPRSRVAIGSVAEQVVQEAPCTVLVFKSADRWQSAKSSADSSPLRFRRIVVGYDHRVGARHALEMACGLGCKQGSHITLVHAMEPAPVFPECMEDMQERDLCVHEALDHLAEVRSQCLPDAHDWELRVEMGEAWDVITRAAKDTRSDLIVVGPHEHTRWGHSYVGSTAQWVVRQAQCPVLVVK